LELENTKNPQTNFKNIVGLFLQYWLRVKGPCDEGEGVKVGGKRVKKD